MTTQAIRVNTSTMSRVVIRDFLICFEGCLKVRYLRSAVAALVTATIVSNPSLDKPVERCSWASQEERDTITNSPDLTEVHSHSQ